MSVSAITITSPVAKLSRPFGGTLHVEWSCDVAAVAPEQFSVWLVSDSNGWYQCGAVLDADGRSKYAVDVAVAAPVGDNYQLFVYRRADSGSGWDVYGYSADVDLVDVYELAVSAVEPAEALAGEQVIITGEGFADDCAVYFGGVSAGLRVTVISDTQLAVVVPAGSGTVDLYVRSRGAQAGLTGGPFTYLPSATGSAPTVTSVVPNTATDNDGGETIAVYGTGFSTAKAVRFGADAAAPQAAFDVVGDTELSVLTPAGSGTVDIVVTNEYGESAVSAADEFTYPDIAVPVVSAISPTGGFEGDLVTITGSGFLEANAVTFGDAGASFLIIDDTTIQCYAPGGTGDVHVTVDNMGGSSVETSADVFSYHSLRLPVTSAANVQRNGFEGWTQGDVTVTLTANANGGYGVGRTYYQLDAGGITEYTAPFVVSGAGSHKLRYWSVDVQGNVEPVHTGYVNILTASPVPTGLSATPLGIDAVLVKWDKIVAERPVSFRVYTGGDASTSTLVAETTANVLSIAQAASLGGRYFAVSSVDVNGTESAKCAAVGPVTANEVTVDWGDMPLITETKIADDAISTPKIQANAVTAAEIDAASVQAAVVTAAAVNALNISANAIQSGTLDTARLNVAEVQAAVVTAAAINALEIDAANITGGNITGVEITGQVITGGLIQTDDSGVRMEMGTRGANSFASLYLYSGDAGESFAGSLLVQSTGADAAEVRLSGCLMDALGTRPQVGLFSGPGATVSKVVVTGKNASLRVGETDGAVDVYGALNVSGALAVLDMPASRKAGVVIEHEFVNTTQGYGAATLNNEFYNGDIGAGLAASGGLAAIDGGLAHPGCMRFYSASSAANSGRNFCANSASIRLSNGDAVEVVFQQPSVASSVRNRFGVMDSMNASSPAKGAWLAVSGATLRGMVNGTSTGTTYTISASTWYTGRIVVGSSSVTFCLYAENGTLLWSSTVAALPTAKGAFFGFATYNTTAENVYTLTIDYLGLYLKPRTR